MSPTDSGLSGAAISLIVTAVVVVVILFVVAVLTFGIYYFLQHNEDYKVRFLRFLGISAATFDEEFKIFAAAEETGPLHYDSDPDF